MKTTKRRAAIYARYSSDLQRDRSIDDQILLCRNFADRDGFVVVATYSDRARSGASVIGRDGLLDLLEAARRKEFDAVIVEALDRISRDQEDLSGIWKRLRFVGVEIVAVHDGQADAVQIGIRGMLGSIFLADLAHKVRRGMSGVVNDGRHAGGRAYGYRPVKGEPGVLEIVEEEAEIVRRIFREYVSGKSPREIAAGLNRDGVTPPRGADWNASTINGNAKRGNGILQNPLYVGRLIWNRVRMVRDPDTGKRVSRVNPESEWQEKPAPELRLVDDATWQAAQNRKRENTKLFSTGERRPRVNHLLSGLIRCGCCGGPMTIHGKGRNDRRRITCSRAKESGKCKETRRIYLDVVERTVVGGLRQRLDNPEALALFVREYREEMRRLAAGAIRERDQTERKLRTVEAAIERLIDAVAAGTIPKEKIGERYAALEADRDRLALELERASAAAPVIELHPEAVEHYRRAVERLAEIVPEMAAQNERLRETTRALVQSVTVHFGPPVEIEIVGHLAALTGAPIEPRGRVALGVVAEDRYRARSHGEVLDFWPLGRFRAAA